METEEFGIILLLHVLTSFSKQMRREKRNNCIKEVNRFFMERELILPVKDQEITTEFIEAEKRNMLKLFPFIESFQTFVTSNEVFSLKKHRWITKASRLLQAYYTLTPDPLYMIFCKN